MAEINTVIAEASQDLQTIEDFVNLPAGSDVRPRLLPSVNVGTLAGARQAIFKAGGLPAEPFATKALMTASALADGKYAMVTEDADNNGLYVKTAGVWVKSAYDPVSISKSYADKVSSTAFDVKYTKPSKNLFNPKDALIGYTLLSTTGEETANPDYISTGKIPVEVGVKYRVTGRFAYMFVYDANDSLLSRHTMSAPIFEDSVATMPAAAAYVRFTITAIGATPASLDDNYLSISKGVEPIAYRKGYPTIDGLKLNDAQISDIKKEVVLDTRKEINLTSENIIDFKGNLFHANKSVIGKRVEADGSEVENSTWHHSDFIPVNPNDIYTLSGRVGSYAFEHIAYYNKDKKFITRDVARTATTTNGRVEVTTPPDAYYAILNMQLSYPTDDERMFYKGSGAKTYERPTLSEDMSKAVFDSLSTDYLKPSINLISHDLIWDNFTLISSSGAKSPNNGFGMVEFIPVEPNTLYTARGGRISTIFYYDSSKAFISRTTSLGEITTPSNAYFVRFILTKPVGGSLEKGQFFAKGRFEDGFYESGYKQITNLKLDDENIEDIGKRLKVSGSPFFLSHSPTSIYDNKASFDGYLDWKTKTPEQVYAMFDALVAAHPTYLTKQPLGVTQEGRELSAYKVTPVRPDASLVTKRRYPKVLIVGSIHGYEKLPALTLYLMLEQMCNNHTSDDMLALLRFNVEFVILPLANPDGWVRNQRKNASEIDLNRNFPSGFAPPTVEPSDEKYGGLSPLSEIESQLINGLIQSNLDADIGIDFHNWFTTGGAPIWVNSLVSPQMEMLTQALIVRMTEKWRKEYTWIPTDADYFAGRSTTAPGHAILARHMQDSGISNCSTYEFSENWGTMAEGVVSYDATFLSTAIEAYINFLVMLLDAVDKNKLG